MRPLRPDLLLCLALALGVGCATHSKPGAPGEPRAGDPRAADPRSPEVVDDEPKHGEISFPRPERETCTPRARTPYRLTVRVRDASGEAFPGVQVHLFPMGAGKEILATVRTNNSGVASLVVNPPGVYAVAVATGGFEPQIRGLRMRPGCSGSTVFNLKLGPVAGQN